MSDAIQVPESLIFRGGATEWRRARGEVGLYAMTHDGEVLRILPTLQLEERGDTGQTGTRNMGIVFERSNYRVSKSSLIF